MTMFTETYSECASRATGVSMTPAAKLGQVVSRFHQEAKPNTSLDTQRQWITH